MNQATAPAVRSRDLAIVLAGGRGSRLFDLTDAQAKPALPVGPSCRLIDFTLANVSNSAIAQAMVLTQYAPESLRSHIEASWQSRHRGGPLGIELLDGSDFGGFNGTADAVGKVRAAIDARAPDLVVILAGDHLYQMDYRPFMDAHRRSGAGVTVGAAHVPVGTAREFGIMQVDDDGRIVDFFEKPATARSSADRPGFALASMGIYVFSWSRLKSLLDRLAPLHEELDFGKHVLPQMVEGRLAHAYTLPGRRDAAPLWRDLGTIDAYHRVHSEMASGTLPLDPSWPVPLDVAAMPVLDPARTHARDSVSVFSWTGSSIAHGALIGAGSRLDNVVVLPGARIGRNVTIHDAIVTQDAVLPDGFELDRALRAPGRWCTISEGGIHVLSARALANLARLDGAALHPRPLLASTDRNRTEAPALRLLANGRR
ncbi:putative glucose-1-phosphate adenylyltransferase [Sphingobium sp. SYK-6]|uniref:glucose-1-phosphate adenylyltransferase family protein n=1 Tax=Sphingobium sp. (strain NBRC 103272 / SYK-6) TaxID=627192 RepID=UPI0002276672|nr:sugar phosphate nucleotidyltransferase [Sphingobium sp. SYK-6]BAK65717.1 putative glucose-1-phosphate adenylyltransferase [Sphingobium sp. SYK-6]